MTVRMSPKINATESINSVFVVCPRATQIITKNGSQPFAAREEKAKGVGRNAETLNSEFSTPSGFS